MTATLTTQTNASQELLDAFRAHAPDGWWWDLSRNKDLTADVLAVRRLPSGNWCALVYDRLDGRYFGGTVGANSECIAHFNYGGHPAMEPAVADYMAAIARERT